MKTTQYRLLELSLIFILTPISFSFNYNPILKLIIAVLGFLYILYVMLNIEKISFKIHKNINWKKFWNFTIIKFIGIAVLTTFYVWFTDKENLFSVILNKPKLWFFILIFYSIFSVYPQEILYRTFFFKRYRCIVKSDTIFIFLNALIFSLAHIMFKNTFVLFFTFAGGILFAFTYKNFKSTLLVSIEHAIYGCWLFTVGMGNLLGFPS